jgi:diguanylate cyclase (GGDEF)-like protein
VGQKLVDRSDRRVAARSAAGMYAAASLVGIFETLADGAAAADLAPPVGALLVAGLLLLVGHRLPATAFAPVGTLMIGIAIATNSSGEGELLFMWPTVFAAYFSSRAVVAAGIAWVGVVHGVVMFVVLRQPNALDSFVDTLASAAVVATVVYSLRERLEREARTDSLTGLLNRRAFRERLEAELVRSRRTGEPVALVVVDADHFKTVNDHRGHAAGDAVLARLGDVLREAARGTDAVARIGGEEFAIVLAGTDAAGADALAARVHAALAATGELTVSAGVAETAPGGDADILLRRADDALYAAKRAGRNRTAVAV